MMLDWYEELYMSEHAAKNAQRIIRRMNQRKATPNVYVLTLPGNEHNVMDIIPSAVLLQEPARRRCPKIIGLARGREDAYELMQRILMETYEHTGEFSVKKYLEDRR